MEYSVEAQPSEADLQYGAVEEARAIGTGNRGESEIRQVADGGAETGLGSTSSCLRWRLESRNA